MFQIVKTFGTCLNSEDKDIILKTIRCGIAPKPRGRRSDSVSKVVYRNIIMSFDIETTQLDDRENAIMYHWQVCLGVDLVITGREWSQFRDLITLISEDLSEHERLVCFVHNLSYEFQWLSGIYHFKPDDVFCMDSRKIAKALLNDKIEFRCSYILTNMSLAEFTTKMNVEHKKLSGEDFDYSIKRYPWSKLSDLEYQYCVNDVLGLNEALYKFITIEDPDYPLYNVPLTSTGFVRRDAKSKVRLLCHSQMVGMQPDYKCMCALREAFRGGNTHANRFWVDTIIKGVKSADRSSSYPDVLVNKEFPSTKWNYCGRQTKELVYDHMKHHYAVLMRVVMTNVTLKDPFWGFPYIPISKCRRGGKPMKESCATMDNGRVIKTDYLEMTITDVDLRIIQQEYKFKIEFREVWYSRYKPLPDVIKALVIRYYKNKTTLKDVEGQENFYMKEKAKLNAIYGLMVQNPMKQTIKYHEVSPDPEDPTKHFVLDHTKTEEELLLKYNNRGFLPYMWGVWCTAWARYELELGLRLSDSKDIIYVDTDSIKYIGDIDFSEYNRVRTERSIKNGAFATDPKGVTHYMGVLEPEPVKVNGVVHESADYFITQGAKKYCALYGDQLKLTCAGVSKKKGAQELSEVYGPPDITHGLRRFRDGFIFTKSAGIEATFNDENQEDIFIDGEQIELPKNVYFRESTYTLGKKGDYDLICKKCKNVLTKALHDYNMKVQTFNSERRTENGNYQTD